MRFSFSTAHYLRKPLPRPELVYQKPKPRPKQKESSDQETKGIQEKKSFKTAKALIKAPSVPIPIKKDKAELLDKFKLDKGQPASLETRVAQRRVMVSEIKSEKIDNPFYLNYYQMIRNKIRNRAYLNYSKMESGEVYLTFILLSNGSLKQIKLIEERSSATSYLKDVGFNSIQEASPFPSFPKDLRYPDLTFNVVISFEVKD